MTPSTHRSLRVVRLFAAVPADALPGIEASCDWRSYAPGKAIVAHKDPSRDVYFLIDGTARVSLYAPNGRQIVIRDAGPGACFGEFAALDGNERSAYVEALTTCLVARMSDKAFVEMLERYPPVTMLLLRHIVGVVRGLTERVFEFSAFAVNNRIQAELLRLAEVAGSTGSTATICPAPTEADIANRISTHREAVSRELSRLSKLGLVEKSRKTLVICDVERLRRLVEDATGEV